MGHISSFTEAWKEDGWVVPGRIERWLFRALIPYLLALMGIVLAASFFKPLDNQMIGLAVMFLGFLVFDILLIFHERKTFRRFECFLISKIVPARPSTVFPLVEGSLDGIGLNAGGTRREQRTSFPYMDLMVYDLDEEGTFLRVKKAFCVDGMRFGRMRNRLMTEIEIGPVREGSQQMVDRVRRLVDAMDLPDYEEDTRGLEGLSKRADLWFNSCTVFSILGGIAIVVLFPIIILIEVFNPRVDFVPVLLSAVFTFLLIFAFFLIRTFQAWTDPAFV